MIQVKCTECGKIIKLLYKKIKGKNYCKRCLKFKKTEEMFKQKNNKILEKIKEKKKITQETERNKIEREKEIAKRKIRVLEPITLDTLRRLKGVDKHEFRLKYHAWLKHIRKEDKRLYAIEKSKIYNFKHKEEIDKRRENRREKERKEEEDEN